MSYRSVYSCKINFDDLITEGTEKLEIMQKCYTLSGIYFSCLLGLQNYLLKKIDL